MRRDTHDLCDDPGQDRKDHIHHHSRQKQLQDHTGIFM